MLIKSVADSDVYMNLLIYGAEGTGKTTYAASAYRSMGKVLFIPIEGGTDTVRGWPVDMTEPMTNAGELDRFAQQLAGGAFPEYKTIVIDSITELVDRELEFLVRDWKRRNPGKSKERDADDVYLEDYGKMTKRLRRILRLFRDIPRHVVMTALQKEVMPVTKKGDPPRPPISIEPFVTDKLSKSVRGLVDHVWFIYQHDGHRYLITQPQGIIKAKTRGLQFAPAIGEKIELSLTYPNGVARVTPDLSDMFELYKKSESPQ